MSLCPHARSHILYRRRCWRTGSGSGSRASLSSWGIGVVEGEDGHSWEQNLRHLRASLHQQTLWQRRTSRHWQVSRHRWVLWHRQISLDLWVSWHRRVPQHLRVSWHRQVLWHRWDSRHPWTSWHRRTPWHMLASWHTKHPGIHRPLGILLTAQTNAWYCRGSFSVFSSNDARRL